MKDIFKNYEKKNRVTGIIALLLVCLYFTRITYGISIAIFIICLLIILKKNKKNIDSRKEIIKEKHDKIVNEGE